MSKWHKYVFDEKRRKFVGEFEKMYLAEKKEGFDSWDQDNTSHLDKRICLEVLSDYNFKKILDLGCGKGSFTQFLKNEKNSVTGIDISKTAIKIARSKCPEINFDVTDFTKVNLEKYCQGRIDLIVCLETLSYIKNWRSMLSIFSRIGEFSLIKLFLPDDPIGYVKSIQDLVEAFSVNFQVLGNIQLIEQKKAILFGKSKFVSSLFK